MLAHTEIEVLVLDEELGPLPVLELARQLQAKHPAVGLLLLAAREASPDLLRQAVRAGFRDVLSAPLTVEALADATARGATWARAVRERSEADDLRPRRRAHRRAASSPSPAPRAASAARRSPCTSRSPPRRQDSERPVCLAELDLQTGDLRSLLDLQSHRSIADLVARRRGRGHGQRSLDDTLYVHSTGLRVLLAPRARRGRRGRQRAGRARRSSAR